jgi:hypothetical protein
MPAPSEGESLLRHLEAALGPFDGSRSGSEPGFSVVALGAPPTFATFGLSHHAIIAQELLLVAEDLNFAMTVLGTLGLHVLDHHRPLAAGETHRLAGWDEASAIGGVLAVPDPVVARYDVVEFVRLIPITDAEASYAREHGWHALVEKLDAVDTANLFRDSVA